jgi:hypothetical protein
MNAPIRVTRVFVVPEAGALGFRDFSGLLAAKENRTGSRQTLL